MQPSTIINNNHLFTEIVIPEEKIQQLKDAETVGEIKTQRKLCIRNNIEKYITQKYFAGLVYRIDSRDLQQIKASKGFHPRVTRNSNDPVLFRDVFEILFDHHSIWSGNVKGVIATSKNIDEFNMSVTEHNNYK